MQDWRFDDLTRTLGKATSRRQVLKGLLAGLGATLIGRGAVPDVAAAATAEVCDRHQCVKQVYKATEDCFHACRALYPPTKFGGSNGAICRFSCFANSLNQRRECMHNATGCFLDGVCCNQKCVDVQTDSNNCGACGVVCPSRAECSEGQCQCDNDLTLCDGTCVDTQTDNTHCGDCQTACDICETCVDGLCKPISCPQGQVCCQAQCVDLCPDGSQPDLNTCECNICKGQIDGASCGTNLVCCQEQCVSNQCSSPKTFNDQTCQCECPPTTCPTGQLLDPDSCQCVDLCANKTCGDCQTCDPTSGDCVSVADQTACGAGQVCCSGVCKDSCGPCTGLPCSNGDCCPNSSDWACCEDGCCPQVTINGQTGAWCVAAGSATDGLGAPAGDCCQPADLVKGSYLQDGVCQCSGPGPYEVWCSNNLVTDLIGTRCSCGPWIS